MRTGTLGDFGKFEARRTETLWQARVACFSTSCAGRVSAVSTCAVCTRHLPWVAKMRHEDENISV